VTFEEFRGIALRFAGAVESDDLPNIDFRVDGRIFAMSYPTGLVVMIKLTPAQQQDFVDAAPKTFRPRKDPWWGEDGDTDVSLSSAEPFLLRRAVQAAWENAMDKP
jgi:hypothetical protein